MVVIVSRLTSCRSLDRTHKYLQQNATLARSHKSETSRFPYGKQSMKIEVISCVIRVMKPANKWEKHRGWTKREKKKEKKYQQQNKVHTTRVSFVASHRHSKRNIKRKNGVTDMCRCRYCWHSVLLLCCTVASFYFRIFFSCMYRILTKRVVRSQHMQLNELSSRARIFSCNNKQV